jgi:exonuclease SbcC
MSWKERIFKPRWQHRKEHIRAEAVSRNNDPRLIETLVEIAGSDESPLVRQKALERVVGLEQLRALHKSETDEDNRVFIHRRMRSLLLSPADAGPDVDSKIKFLTHWDDTDSIERLAKNSTDAGLRLAALKKIDRQGFLGDRAIKDSDALIRQYAVRQLTQQSTMERVEEALRTRDKQLYRELNEKLQQQRLKDGDTGTANRSVELLMRQLDNLVKGASIGERHIQLAKIDAGWKELESHATAELKKRFANARAIIQHALDNPVTTLDPAEKSKRALSATIRQLDRLTADRDFAHCKQSLQNLQNEIGEMLTSVGEQFDAAPLIAEFETAQEHVSRHLAQLASTQEVDEGIRRVLDVISSIPDGAHVSRKRFDDLSGDWQKAWGALKAPNSREETMKKLASESLARLDARITTGEQRQHDQLAAAVAVLDRMEKHVEDGALSDALEAHTELEKLLPRIKRDREWVTGDHSSRLVDLQAKIRELRDWQHWSNGKIRNRLIEKAEQLLEADINADAIVASVKEMQARWKALEVSEQIPGDKHFASSASAWRRFNVACNKAFDKARPFLEKRTEFREHRQQEMELLCKRLNEAIEAPEQDWKTLQRGMKKARETMRHLDEVPPRARQKTAKLLRNAMDAVSAALDGHNQSVEQTKRRLIREAQQIVHIEEPSEAIEKAKTLQREWQSAGTTWRSMDQKLWNEFREPIDPLFAAATEARKTEKVAHDERHQQFTALCTQIEGLSKLSGEEVLSQGGRISGFEAEWRDLGEPPKSQAMRFAKGVKAFELRLEQERENVLNQERGRWQQKLKQCQLLEAKLVSGKTVATLLKKTVAAWEGQFDTAVDKLMDERLQRINAATEDSKKSATLFADQESDTAAASTLAIRLEFLAGLDSPAECSDARMEYQVNRLAQTLGDASSRLPVMEELHEIEMQWYSLGPLSADELESLQQRLELGIADIVKLNA